MTASEPPVPPPPPGPPPPGQAAPQGWGGAAPPWGSPSPSGWDGLPPAGAAGPAGWPASPPSQKIKLTWLWITLGILGVLGVVAVVAAVMFAGAVRDPVDSMNDYLRAVEREDYDTAYGMLCTEERDATSRESFPEAISLFADDLDEWSVYSFDPTGNRRQVQFDVVDFDGDHTTYEATMVKEQGAWRVCDFFEDSDLAPPG